jgi:hypothetical protein
MSRTITETAVVPVQPEEDEGNAARGISGHRAARRREKVLAAQRHLRVKLPRSRPAQHNEDGTVKKKRRFLVNTLRRRRGHFVVHGKGAEGLVTASSRLKRYLKSILPDIAKTIAITLGVAGKPERFAEGYMRIDQAALERINLHADATANAVVTDCSRIATLCNIKTLEARHIQHAVSARQAAASSH